MASKLLQRGSTIYVTFTGKEAIIVDSGIEIQSWNHVR